MLFSRNRQAKPTMPSRPQTITWRTPDGSRQSRTGNRETTTERPQAPQTIISKQSKAAGRQKGNKMDKEKAIKILDEVIPPPEHYMVDLDHLQIAQAWACIKEMLTANTIKLSTGEYYKPKKGEYPVCPCDECKDRNSAKWAACNAGLGVCAAYMDYEHMKAVYRLTVFE